MFKGKSVFITGVSGGIGRLLATRFLAEEATVYGTYFENPPHIQGAFVYRCDVTDQKSIDAICGELPAPDILINNAAITMNGFADRMNPDDWCKTTNVNLDGVFRVINAFLLRMKLNGGGSIINIGSVLGEIGSIGCSAYVASKAGLVGLTKAVAKEVSKDNITANVLSLGYFDIGLGKRFNEELKKKIIGSIPLGRFGFPEEIVRAVFYLANSRYMTGATLQLTGGL